MTPAAHKARALRHPLPSNLVYGYEVVISRQTDSEKYSSTLYAVDTEGQVLSRVTSSLTEFNNPKAFWVRVDELPAHAEFIGNYHKEQKVRP